MLQLSLLTDGTFNPQTGEMGCSFAVFYGTPDEGLLLHHTSRAAVPWFSIEEGPSITTAEMAALVSGLIWMRSEGMLKGFPVTVFADCESVLQALRGDGNKARGIRNILQIICKTDRMYAAHYPSEKMKKSIIGH